MGSMGSRDLRCGDTVTANVGDDARLLLLCLFVQASTNSVTSLNIHPGIDGRRMEREGAPKAAPVESSVSPVMTGTQEGACFKIHAKVRIGPGKKSCREG